MRSRPTFSPAAGSAMLVLVLLVVVPAKVADRSRMLVPPTDELVPANRPFLSPLLPNRPCHWKPKSAALSPVTSTIMLSM